jgi:hypothetical protein
MEITHCSFLGLDPQFAFHVFALFNSLLDTEGKLLSIAAWPKGA